MSKWKTIQYHYHKGLEYVGKSGLKPEMYNPRYTGELAFQMSTAMKERNKGKVVRIFYERICCSGKNGCIVLPKKQRKNSKMCKFVWIYTYGAIVTIRILWKEEKGFYACIDTEGDHGPNFIASCSTRKIDPMVIIIIYLHLFII
jgi:hypothetical protein